MIELKDYLVFVGFGYCIIISLIEIELVCWFFIKKFIIRLIEDKLFIRVRWFFIFDYVKLKIKNYFILMNNLFLVNFVVGFLVGG